jgi:transposase
MPRVCGYSDKGTKCHGSYKWSNKGKVNAIGAVVDKVFFATVLFFGSICGDVFYHWVANSLMPELPVVVMDNVSFHKREDVVTLLKKEGHKVIFLPPYSPDLNPIEHKWAEAKQIKRKLQCSTEELFATYL